jgi:hypothetical protein
MRDACGCCGLPDYFSFVPGVKMRLATTLRFDFPHKADSDLGGNSRAHWRKKYNKLQADKNTGWAFTLEALTRAGTLQASFLLTITLTVWKMLYPFN